MRNSINLVNFKQLFKEEYVEDVDHPNYEEYKNRGYPIKKLLTSLNKETLENMYPFATVFSKRGWDDKYDIFIKELPPEFKIIFESKCAVNNTHKLAGKCQWIVVVDKV